MLVIDANVVLRYLLNDNTDMAKIAQNAINSGASCLIEVIAEVVYVLDSVYKVERTKIAQTILQLLEEVYIENKPVLKRAMQIYANVTLDFIDCILIARHQILGNDILSFDKKLNKNLDVSIE